MDGFSQFWRSVCHYYIWDYVLFTVDIFKCCFSLIDTHSNTDLWLYKKWIIDKILISFLSNSAHEILEELMPIFQSFREHQQKSGSKNVSSLCLIHNQNGIVLFESHTLPRVKFECVSYSRVTFINSYEKK